MPKKGQHKWIPCGGKNDWGDRCEVCDITKGMIIKSISTKHASAAFAAGKEISDFFQEELDKHLCLSDEEANIKDIIE